MNRFVAILAMLVALPTLALDFCPEKVERYAYVYMTTTAVPSPAAAVQPIQGSFYDPSVADGMRLRVRSANREFYLPGYDWEIKPLIEFVASGNLVAAKATIAEYSMDTLYSGSLIDRLLSLRLLQAMMVGRGFVIEDHELAASGFGVAPAPGEVASEPFAGIENHEAVSGILSETMEPTFSGLVDFGHTFQYRYGKQGQIEMRGRPFFAYWEEPEGELRVKGELGPQVAKIWAELVRCHPMAMKTAVRAFRITAFLRMLSQTVPQDWQHVIDSYRRVVIPVVKSPNQILLSP